MDSNAGLDYRSGNFERLCHHFALHIIINFRPSIDSENWKSRPGNGRDFFELVRVRGSVAIGWLHPTDTLIALLGHFSKPR
jgi:hypothetical protein